MDMRLSSVLTSDFSFAKFQTQAAFPRPSPISLAPARKLLMATYPDRAKIWKLGSGTLLCSPRTKCLAVRHPEAQLEAGTSLPLDADYKEQLAILTEVHGH